VDLRVAGGVVPFLVPSSACYWDMLVQSREQIPHWKLFRSSAGNSLIAEHVAGATSRPPNGRDAPPQSTGPGLPARWVGGMPRRPHQGPGNNFGTSSLLDGREVPGPTPPTRSSRGRYPFSEILPISTPFSNLFFIPFSKKNSRHHTAEPSENGSDPLSHLSRCPASWWQRGGAHRGHSSRHCPDPQIPFPAPAPICFTGGNLSPASTHPRSPAGNTASMSRMAGEEQKQLPKNKNENGRKI
jgi:hypothetical protein